MCAGSGSWGVGHRNGAARGEILGPSIPGSVSASLVLASLLRSLLLDLSPYDPIALLGVTALLLTVVLAATWIPARRAALVDPAESLRAD